MRRSAARLHNIVRAADADHLVPGRHLQPLDRLLAQC
jgi:hypothetical protein